MSRAVAFLTARAHIDTRASQLSPFVATIVPLVCSVLLTLEGEQAINSRTQANVSVRDGGERPATTIAEWSNPVARQAHNLEVRGSNPRSATNATSSVNRWNAFRLVAPNLPEVRS
jgi:hypothetical protein